MAARDAVVLSGGPNWEVKLGRLDSLTASQEDSSDIMPSPRANATTLIDLFSRFNLSVKDLVALSGSHSIGKGRKKLDKLCPLGGDENVTGNLDATPEKFDNQYFKDLVNGRGFLNSDQTLFTCPETREYVRLFSRNQSAFFKAFVEGMLKLGDLQSWRTGEIRKNCRIINSRTLEGLFDDF
ncbi:Peroxidase 17 [Forsythia ovata]|uniref:peroxidase n=1 Tax=Forsythia ovata TaxID=205694 RepID=A0ABD1WNV8_9LAMI